MSYLRRRKNAFFYAFQGVGASIKREDHMKIHLVAALLVVGAGFYLNISANDWCVLIFAIAFVITIELINTAIEKLCDMVMPEPHPTVKYIKDISAAAVLLACIAAVIVGFVIFWRYVAPGVTV
jgi:diacylglycerol kinase